MPHPSLLENSRKIIAAALQAADPEKLMEASVSIQGEELRIQEHKFDLKSFKNIYVVAFGKAAPFMAKSLDKILGTRIRDGVFLYLPQHQISLDSLKSLPASHPLPDERSLQASREILELAAGLGKKDLLLVLISGGGSSQLCLPAAAVSLAEKRNLTELLLKAGADIQDLNTLRKHLSGIKGGQLARAAYPATVISLIISDVIGNDPGTIASGPTYWDSSSYRDALQVLKKYRLENLVPASVVHTLEKGIRGEIPETLGKQDRAFSRTYNLIIGENRNALSAARSRAEELGFRSFILTSSDRGEARDAARNYLSFLSALREDLHPQAFCVLAGGELTVRVAGDGRGGRNQEFILALLNEIHKKGMVCRDWLILSLGTDGIDGPTDAAGAWITPLSLDKAQRLSLEFSQYLDNNDSYNFFAHAGGLIKTGPTHTNVMDIRVFLLVP